MPPLAGARGLRRSAPSSSVRWRTAADGDASRPGRKPPAGRRTSAVPAFDAGAYPAMAAVGPLMADFGSPAEFDRMLDSVLAGITGPSAPE